MCLGFPRIKGQRNVAVIHVALVVSAASDSPGLFCVVQCATGYPREATWSSRAKAKISNFALWAEVEPDPKTLKHSWVIVLGWSRMSNHLWWLQTITGLTLSTELSPEQSHNSSEGCAPSQGIAWSFSPPRRTREEGMLLWQVALPEGQKPGQCADLPHGDKCTLQFIITGGCTSIWKTSVEPITFKSCQSQKTEVAPQNRGILLKTINLSRHSDLSPFQWTHMLNQKEKPHDLKQASSKQPAQLAFSWILREYQKAIMLEKFRNAQKFLTSTFIAFKPMPNSLITKPFPPFMWTFSFQSKVQQVFSGAVFTFFKKFSCF